MNLESRIREVVYTWPQWSRAERCRMEDVFEEIMEHVRDGTGNRFVREFCNRVLVPKIEGMVKT